MSLKSAAGFVVFRRFFKDVEYLLLQTSYGEHHWTPPKGHLDPGENEITAAFRETKEESGLDSKDLKVYEDSKKVLNYTVRNNPKIVTYWLAELINSEAAVNLSEEHQDYKWLSLKEACLYGKYPDLQEMLKYFDEYIKQKLT